jgi:hypothetical protein
MYKNELLHWEYLKKVVLYLSIVKTNCNMKTIFLFLSAIFLVLSVNAQDVLVGAGANITVGKNAGFYVEGGMLLENNGTLYNEGIIVLTKNNNSKADFIDNAGTAYNYGTGRFIFSGTGVQNIKTNNRFGIVEVDNKGLNLLSNVNADKWDLKKGTVNTGKYYVIAAASQRDWFSADGGNNRFSNSWINGNLRQYILPADINNYVLPVGDANHVKVCEIDNLTRNPLTGVQYIDVSFARPTGWNNDLKATENGMKYNSVNSAGMWNMMPDAKPVGGSFDLKLSVADFAGLWDNRFAVLNRSAADWTVPAGSSLPADGSIGRTVAGGFAQRNNVRVFNQFAIANMDALPADVIASYKVYPDPVTDNEFFIQVKNYQLSSFKMFSADGKEINVNSVTQKNGLVKVSLPSSFAKGNYIVQLNTDKGLKSCKIIVQ